MPTLHSSCSPLLPGDTFFPQWIFNYFPSRSRAEVFRSTSMTSCAVLWRTSLTCTGHPCRGIKMGMNVCLYITWSFSLSGVCCGIPFCKAPTLSCPLGIFPQQEWDSLQWGFIDQEWILGSSKFIFLNWAASAEKLIVVGFFSSSPNPPSCFPHSPLGSILMIFS